MTGSVGEGGPECASGNRTGQVAWTALDAFVRGVDLLRRRGEVGSGLQLLVVASIWPVGTIRLPGDAMRSSDGRRGAVFHDCDAMIKTSDEALAMRTNMPGSGRRGDHRAGPTRYGALLRAEPDQAYRSASQAFRGARVLDRELEFGLRSLVGAPRSTAGSTGRAAGAAARPR